MKLVSVPWSQLNLSKSGMHKDNLTKNFCCLIKSASCSCILLQFWLPWGPSALHSEDKPALNTFAHLTWSDGIGVGDDMKRKLKKKKYNISAINWKGPFDCSHSPCYAYSRTELICRRERLHFSLTIKLIEVGRTQYSSPI